ncbi:MAG: tetratricopeptide repeat protein [Cystobacterineae bacterium]|nr:tetratricopeptide repeat protein [Cystobacterineae bacterium]
MPPPSKTVTAAELAKLEQSFAANPTSDAWQPLAEAYLAMGRYMEAMVVCRKGARANATSPKPRLLLAEVYIAQGKEAKAKEEAQAALQIAPHEVAALRLCGHLQMKLGETEEGTAKLLAAARADLTDMQTQTVLAQWGIPMPVPPPLTVASEQAPSPSAPPQAAHSVSLPEAAHLKPPPPPPAAPPVHRPEWIAPVELEEPKKRGGASAALWTLVFVLVGGLSVGVYVWVEKYKTEQRQKITNHLRNAAEQFKRDNHAAYQRAVEEAREALKLDEDSATAHAYLAYAQAIRLEEHAGGEAALEEAKKSLAIAKQSGEVLSYTHMAEALLDTYHGKVQQAEKTLADLVRKYEGESEQKRPALLLMTLGNLQMILGDLDAASESLEKSQRYAPDAPRVYALSGKLARQKGNIPEAKRLYELALKYERNHPDSLIGRSWALLEQKEPGLSYITVAQDLNNLLDGKRELSVRQEAMAHMLHSLLIARLSADLPSFKTEIQKELENKTGIGTSKAKNASAISAAETAARIDSQNPELQLLRAQRLAVEGNMEAAIEQVNQAIVLAPSSAYLHIELARLLAKKAPASKEAETVLRSARKMAPRNPVIPIRLAKILLEQRKTEEAIGLLQEATTNLATKNPEAKMLLAQIFRENRKDHAKATALYMEAISEFERDKANVARAYLELGITHEKAGALKQSKEAYEQAKAVDYSFETAYCRLGDVLEASEEPEDKEELQKLANTYLSVPAWAQQGECATKMQQRSEANK